jgi:cytochrome c-type biogenesis protein
MIDPLGAAMLALTSRTPAALALVFVAGVVTSVGPCVAPRYLAVAAIVGRDRHPLVPTLAYVGGLIGALTAVGFAGGLLGRLGSASRTIDVILAAALIAGGAHALVRAQPPPGHEDHGVCEGAGEPAKSPRSIGAVFLLGAASALVISPCCTPVVATIAATTTATGEPLFGALLLALFGAGHSLPLLITSQAGATLTRRLPLRSYGQASAIVSAVLMLALGGYYAVIA